jgi:hypothetical protein
MSKNLIIAVLAIVTAVALYNNKNIVEAFTATSNLTTGSRYTCNNHLVSQFDPQRQGRLKNYSGSVDNYSLSYHKDCDNTSVNDLITSVETVESSGDNDCNDQVTQFRVDANDLPVTDMNNSGDNEEKIVYDRVIIAQPLKSRLSEGADNIRGDLAIPPCANGLEGGEWGRPDVSSNLSSILSTGIFVDQHNKNNVLELISSSSAGTQSFVGGVHVDQMTANNTFPTVQQTNKGKNVNVSLF